MKSAIVAALMSLGFQPFWAFQVFEVGERHGVEPAVIAGVILSEHNGTLKDRSITVANKKSGCIGLGQIAPFWARFYGITMKDLQNPMVNIDITARVIRGAQDRHARHSRGSKHHYLAHYKCGVKNLDGCPRPVRNALRHIAKVEDAIEAHRGSVAPTILTMVKLP